MDGDKESEDTSSMTQEEKDALASWESMMGAAPAPAVNGDPNATEEQQVPGMPARTLNQTEIDDLLGVSKNASGSDELTVKGIRLMLDKALMAYERLPMLEIVFDRFARMLSTGLRNLTSENVDVDIIGINSLRFGDFINSIPMPALLSIFKVLEWENFGIVTVDSYLIYSMVDLLFGGRKASRPIRLEARPYTTIEQSVVKQIIEIIMTELSGSFEPLSPSTFVFERMEINPRFATIARPADAAILLKLRVDMYDRGGKIDILMPYATLEPLRELLTQVFVGDSFGKDVTWEMHLESEVSHTPLEMSAILDQKMAMMQDVMKFAVGSTIVMDSGPDAEVSVCCAGIKMFTGKVGSVGNNIAVSINKVFNKKSKDA